jgi:hypothetical protein
METECSSPRSQRLLKASYLFKYSLKCLMLWVILIRKSRKMINIDDILSNLFMKVIDLTSVCLLSLSDTKEWRSLYLTAWVNVGNYFYLKWELLILPDYPVTVKLSILHEVPSQSPNYQCIVLTVLIVHEVSMYYDSNRITSILCVYVCACVHQCKTGNSIVGEWDVNVRERERPRMVVRCEDAVCKKREVNTHGPQVALLILVAATSWLHTSITTTTGPACLLNGCCHLIQEIVLAAIKPSARRFCVHKGSQKYSWTLLPTLKLWYGLISPLNLCS